MASSPLETASRRAGRWPFRVEALRISLSHVSDGQAQRAADNFQRLCTDRRRWGKVLYLCADKITKAALAANTPIFTVGPHQRRLAHFASALLTSEFLFGVARAVAPTSHSTNLASLCQSPPDAEAFVVNWNAVRAFAESFADTTKQIDLLVTSIRMEQICLSRQKIDSGNESSNFNESKDTHSDSEKPALIPENAIPKKKIRKWCRQCDTLLNRWVKTMEEKGCWMPQKTFFDNELPSLKTDSPSTWLEDWKSRRFVEKFSDNEQEWRSRVAKWDPKHRIKNTH